MGVRIWRLSDLNGFPPSDIVVTLHILDALDVKKNRSSLPKMSDSDESWAPVLLVRNCLQWGRSNVVDPAEWPKLVC